MAKATKVYFGNVPVTPIGGPQVKIHRMAQFFENCIENYNLIYALYGFVTLEKVRQAKSNGVKIIQHINSFYHRAYAPNYVEKNKGIQELYHLADAYVFGSNHARLAAKSFFEDNNSPEKIIYNAVDQNLFKPYLQVNKEQKFNLLCAGWHYIDHRLFPIVESLPEIIKKIPHTHLTIAGKIESQNRIGSIDPGELIQRVKELDLNDHISFLGSYDQSVAPRIYQDHQLLVHLKHMDWTPNVVVEAMSCGMPILYSGSGGVGELTKSGGLSLGIENDWDNIRVPKKDAIVTGVTEAYKNLENLRQEALEIARANYSLNTWVKSHNSFFEQVLN